MHHGSVFSFHCHCMKTEIIIIVRAPAHPPKHEFSRKRYLCFLNVALWPSFFWNENTVCPYYVISIKHITLLTQKMFFISFIVAFLIIRAVAMSGHGSFSTACAWSMPRVMGHLAWLVLDPCLGSAWRVEFFWVKSGFFGFGRVFSSWVRF